MVKQVNPTIATTGLLWYYYVQHRRTSDPEYQRHTLHQLASLIDQPSLRKHDTRALLIVEVLLAQEWVNPGLMRRISTYEAHLVANAQDWLAQPSWEYLYRAVEVGYYLAHRRSDHLTRWVNSLIAASPPSGFFRIRAQSEPMFLLGVEGLTGILLMLEAVARLTKEVMLCDIVQEGLSHLLSFRQEVDFSAQRYAVFPRLAHENNQRSPRSGSLSWSGSDLTQALLLYRAAGLLQDDALRRTADLVGLNTLLRKEETGTAVDSINVYQGTAGIAQCYRALYQASGQTAYQLGYVYWMNRTVQQLSDDDAWSSYQESNLWHGWVGIALALLSHQSPGGGWEKVMLLG